MLDGTVCDIYLVDDAGHLVGRPILLACVDAYTSFCYGYSLLWEGGVRPVKISKYGTAMAAMHDLPANKWHRTLDRYFHEYVEVPELSREAPLAMVA